MAASPISVVIRARNEGRDLRSVLDGIAAQDWDGGVDVIVVDSGSTDDTLQIAQAGGARVISIEPEEFSFGRALNVGIGASTGELISILNGHTPPVGRTLFSSFAQHFVDAQVAGVGGREGPTRWCNPCEAHDRDDYYTLEPVPGRLVFSNGNSMVRRSVWEQFPFDEELPGTEDIEWALRVMAAGLEVRYEPRAEVVHCHSASPRYVYKRFYREELWLVKSGTRTPMRIRGAAKCFLKSCARDALYAMRRRMNPLWLPYIPVYRGAQTLGALRAGRRVLRES